MAGLELSQELVDWAAATLGWRPSRVPFEAQGRAVLRGLGAQGCSP